METLKLNISGAYYPEISLLRRFARSLNVNHMIPLIHSILDREITG